MTCGDGDETGSDTVISDRRSIDAVAPLCENVDALPEPGSGEQSRREIRERARPTRH